MSVGWPIDELVLLPDFRPPAEPPAQAARGRLRRLWARLRRERRDEEGPAPDSLERPDGAKCQPVLPRGGPETALPGLEGLLDGWMAGPAGPARVVVAPPGAGVEALLRAFAGARRHPVLEPPGRTELLEPQRLDAAWPPADPSRPLVVPALERWLLRRASALATFRRLVERLVAWPAPLLVGCDSWAWAYLRRALELERQVAEVWAPAPVEGSGLCRWLAAPFRDRGLELFDGRSGRPLAGPLPEAGASGEDAAPSAVFQRLAAASRGNPGVALALWRTELRTRDDGDCSSWWIEPPDENELPRLPRDADRALDLLLEALLIHNGIEPELLAELVPGAGGTAPRLRELERAGVVAGEGGELVVTPAAYPTVRRRLAQQKLLIDDL